MIRYKSGIGGLFGLMMTILLAAACSNDKKPPVPIVSTIVVQPFSGISKKQVEIVATQLKLHFSAVKVNETIDLPKQAFYTPRKRYRADSLLNFLSAMHLGRNVTVLGITNKDISIGKNGVSDWGVMGLSYRPGRSSVISTFRLSKQQVDLQLYKVAVHELGHASELAHCPVKSCYMRNAEGRNPLNEETEFCKTCSAWLVKKGWML